MPLPIQIDVTNTPLPIPESLTSLLEEEIQRAYQQTPPTCPDAPMPRSSRSP